MENTNEAGLATQIPPTHAHKTCLVTIVQPGLPDSVLRIGPSDHESEKIWLDRRPGQERWESIKALMQRFCPRGKYVPEPAYYHPPTGKQEDLGIRLINSPEDIPHIHLEGAILSAPPADERSTRVHPDNAAKVAQAEIADLKSQVTRLTTLVEVAMGQKQFMPIPSPVSPAPAPVAPAMATPTGQYICDCGKQFDGKRALHMHKVGAHREKKP